MTGAFDPAHARTVAEASAACLLESRRPGRPAAGAGTFDRLADAFFTCLVAYFDTLGSTADRPDPATPARRT